MIFVFKTNCNNIVGASLVRIISQFKGINQINFDFEDCDNILRVDAEHNISEQITSFLISIGCECKELH